MSDTSKLKTYTVVLKDGTEIDAPGEKVEIDRDKDIVTIKEADYNGEIFAVFNNARGAYVKEHRLLADHYGVEDLTEEDSDESA